MATAPDGWVSETRLQELLARQGETFDLDYKSVLDIKDDPRHRLKLVKLVAAMTALGGDIVVGVDGRGKPTGKVTQELAPVYDEANLRSILRGYLPPELRCIARRTSSTGTRSSSSGSRPPKAGRSL